MECVTMCVWLGAGGVWVRGLVLGFTNPGGTGGKWAVWTRVLEGGWC